jgi:hypothetical protein
MICPTCRGRQFVPDGPAGDDETVRMKPCPDCIGGIASCCDAAGSAEGPSEAEIERSQARIGAILEASYRDDTFPERLCDRCGTLYRGPAVYCSLQCALDDAA